MNSPQAFGSYDLIERIHLGAMAEVFRAYDLVRDRQVAIKRLLPSVAREEEFIESFMDEAAVASELVHPNIASIYELGKIEDREYVSLEFVNGRDLRAIFDSSALRGVPLPLDFILDVAAQICVALGHAHQQSDSRRPRGIMHGDVSPPNVIIADDGTAKLINFGIANAVAKLTQTQVGTVKNKFGYFSPERALGAAIDPSSEVFSLGVCLWELLTLERLFSGESLAAILEKVRTCDVPRLTERVAYVPVRLERIVLKALAKDVSERYATVAELETELVEFARTQNLVLDRSRAAEYMQRVFAAGARANDSNGEKSMTSEQKNSSDLDVFEGLSRKKADPDQAAAPLASLAPPNFTVMGRKTLVGMPITGSAVPSSPDPTAPPELESFPTSNAATSTMAFGTPLPQPAVPPAGSFGTLLGMPVPSNRSSNADNSALPSFSPPAQTGGASATSGFASDAGPPVKRARSPMDVDMDWDEEDEKTSVFEREETTVYERGEGSMPSYPPTAASGITSPGAYGSSPLPYTSYLPPPQSPLPNPGLVPPPAMSRTGTFSAPPPAIGRISSGPTSTATFAPPTLSPPTIDLNQVNVPSPFGARAGNRNWMVYAGVAAMVAIALIFVATGRRGGKVAVFAASASGKPLAKMAVYVDGVQKCSASPCTLDLDKGIHYIKASADGYSAQGEGTTVRAGDEFALNFKLDRSSAGTGLKVTGRQDGVELFVDGKSIGPLPQEVKDLAPGPHQIGFKGSDRYAPEERTISVDTDEIKDMGSVSLRVLRGLASFDVRTPGVKVTLVSGKDRRQLTDFSQPVEIETSKSWTIEATKPGYDDFRQPITFEDRAEKTFVIVLQEHIGAQPVAAAPAPAPAPRPQPQPAPALQAAINPSNDSDTSSDDSAPNRAAATGSCTLNLNSIPVSNVLLDGRPIGGTPRVGVTTTAGTHNILFVGPEGRKLQTVSCRAGETKAVGVRLTP